MSSPRLEEAAHLSRRPSVADPKQSASSPNLEGAARPPPVLKQLLVHHRTQLRSMTRTLQMNHSPPCAPPKQSTSSPNLEGAVRPPPMLKQLLVNHRTQLRSMTRTLQMNHSPPGDGRTGLDVGVQKHETNTGLSRRRSSLLNEDFRVVAGRRRSSIAYHVESFENLIDWANKS